MPTSKRNAKRFYCGSEIPSQNVALIQRRSVPCLENPIFRPQALQTLKEFLRGRQKALRFLTFRCVDCSLVNSPLNVKYIVLEIRPLDCYGFPRNLEPFSTSSRRGREAEGLGLRIGTNQSRFYCGFLQLSYAESVNFHCVPNQVLYQAEPLPD
jgi:hypothetical protein